ncbi:MAG: cyclic nucleotide-binding domain-containing protein [Desulfobacterales bacterium]|jgi:CRP-like cAMP-binding protein
MADPIAQEKLLETYIKENKKDLAVELLFDLITQNAKAKNFSKADALREKLFEVDSLALNAIVKSAEMIETEKIAAIDPIHRDTWAHLYEELTKEETIALYYEMKTATLEAEQMVFRQGGMNSNLYFFDSGRLNMFYHKGNHGILLKSLGPGDIAGEDTFFTQSTCTTSLIAHSRVKLNYLEKSVLQKWQSDAPNLNNKLQDYCLKLQPLKDLLQKKELERRAHKRYAISGTAAIQIIDKPEGKVYKAELSDISAKGVSFIMNTSPQSADVLLGCQLSLKFLLPRVSDQTRIDQDGIIVGVHRQLFNEYLINVKWDHPLSNDIIAQIKSSSLSS